MKLSENKPAPTHENMREVFQACIDHARDLLSAARAVQDSGHPNIAYHLATLAMEEIGRRELIKVQLVSKNTDVPPAWPIKHAQDHIQKLFWCFFSGFFPWRKITNADVADFRRLATSIHTTRLSGLYVEHDEGGLSIPKENISLAEGRSQIEFAEARLAMVGDEQPDGTLSPEDAKLQAWLFKAMDDIETRRQVLSRTSLEKLAELKDGREWIKWLKELFDNADAEARLAAEEEIKRSRNLPEEGSKDKWKLRIRIFSASHSVRPAALSAWNNNVDWIKLSAVPEKRNQLLVDFVLKDNIPVGALWYFGWGLARHFVVALNVATLGFWWWRMPEQINKYYERLDDIETGRRLDVERVPNLKIDWGSKNVLGEQDLRLVMSCFVALPKPQNREKHKAYNFYIGGLTFLSLNDIHWQCEATIFGNFLQSLKAMMSESGDWDGHTPFEHALVRFLDDCFPKFDEQPRFVELCRAYEIGNPEGSKVTLKEASFMKAFCDAFFLRSIRPRALSDVLSDELKINIS